MNEYLRQRYGDPCRDCGYDWSIDADAARAVVLAQADRYAEIVAGHAGDESIPELGWNVSAYVSHVADNTRIWAERLVADGVAVGYEEDDLAAVRGYNALDLRGALWSLRRATGDLEEAMAVGTGGIRHPDQGDLPLGDILRVLAHEASHHGADLVRITGHDAGE